MSGVALALHAGATGGQPLDAYLGDIREAGVAGVEWCLGAAWSERDLALAADALALLEPLEMFAHLRLPPAGSQHERDWQGLADLARAQSARQPAPVHLVLEGQAAEAGASSAEIARLLASLCGPAARPVIRLGVATASRSLPGRLRRWWSYRREDRGRIGPPPGTVRPGLGGPELAVATPAPGEADAPLDASLAGGETATRAGLLATVEAAAGAAGLCWDLGRDWLTGVRGGQPGWTTMPEPPFLAAVEHLEVCDALPAGHTQMPLLPGNVPYTTQLRALAGRPVAVTLDIAYGDLALRLGERFQTLARSVKLIQRALRLHV